MAASGPRTAHVAVGVGAGGVGPKRPAERAAQQPPRHLRRVAALVRRTAGGDAGRVEAVAGAER